MHDPTAEEVRLEQDRRKQAAWKRWGPYVSDRSWGTVREDYSPHGTAWEYFPHDHARSKAYRWGEDGLAGGPGHVRAGRLQQGHDRPRAPAGRRVGVAVHRCGGQLLQALLFRRRLQNGRRLTL